MNVCQQILVMLPIICNDIVVIVEVEMGED